jgi:hypothetical protein
MKKSNHIPNERFKAIWISISEVNARIKELNEKLLSLKDYIDSSIPEIPEIPEIDTSQFITKDKVFKDGNLEKNIEIDKGNVGTEKTNIYLGGSYQRVSQYADISNNVTGYGAIAKFYDSAVLGINAHSGGAQNVTIGNAARTSGDLSTSVVIIKIRMLMVQL